MKNSKLYAFIKRNYEAPQDWKPFLKEKFVIKENENPEKSFILYNLELTGRDIVAGELRYTLESHHVSFYRKYKDNIIVLSECHYTAYVYNNLNEKFELHVYFGRNDQVDGEPLFSRITDNNTYVQQDITSEFSRVLVQLALEESYDFIAELRSQQRKFLDDLKYGYEKLLSELTELSTALPQKREQYLNQLQKATDASEILTIYHYDDRYKKLNTLHQNIKKSLEPIATVVSTKDKDEDTNPAITPDTTVFSNDNNAIEITAKPSLAPLLDEAQKALDLFKTSLDKSDEEKLKCFNQFDELIHDIFWTNQKDFAVTTEDLIKLQMLVTKNTFEGRNLLQRFLLQDNISCASKMIRFINSLPESFFSFALKKANAKLMEFYLTYNKDFPINTCLIDNNSPVIYCYLNHTKFPKLIDCLAVLIKFDASIMVKVDNLPLAHLIQEYEHPLRLALEENFDKTLGNPRFFKELNCYLQNYVLNSKPGEKTVDKILSAIESYKLMSEFDYSKSFSKILQQTDQHQSHLVKRFDKSKIDELKNDTDIKNNYLQLQLVFNEYNKTLSSFERKKLMKVNNTRLSKLEEIMERIEINSSEYKVLVLQTLDDYIRIYRLKLEYIPVRHTLLTEKVSQKRINKARTAQNRILQELNPLLKKYNVFDEDQKDQSGNEWDIVFEIDESSNKASLSVQSMNQFMQQMRAAIEFCDTLSTDNNNNSDITKLEDIFTYKRK